MKRKRTEDFSVHKKCRIHKSSEIHKNFKIQKIIAVQPFGCTVFDIIGNLVSAKRKKNCKAPLLNERLTGAENCDRM